MSRVLVLGATGFIGRNMADHFSTLGYDVVRHGFSRPADINCDLREPMAVKYLLKTADIVIQCAAVTSGSKDIVNNPTLHVTDNAVMNAYIFRAAHEANAKHLIFFSCTTMWKNGHLSEDSPIDIHPKYFGVAHTKLHNEKMCEFYASLGNAKFTVIRHSNIYGPHDKFDLEKSHVTGATITKVMAAKDKITLWGTGEEERDLLYVDDLCEFVELAIDKQTKPYGLYNCGSGNAISINDLAGTIIERGNKDIHIEHDLSKPTIPTSLSLDCSKAKAELGWEPKTSLKEGISKTIAWYKENVRVL